MKTSSKTTHKPLENTSKQPPFSHNTTIFWVEVTESRFPDVGLSWFVAVVQTFMEFLYYAKDGFTLMKIYEWINNSERLYLSPRDVAVRLDLISKAHGLKAAEKYFASTPDILRASCVYGALLNCYADAKSWSKVEGIMQKMRDLQDANLVTYTLMMNLYAKMGNLEKLHLLVQEMEYKGIAGDSISYNIRLNAYASVPDVIGMEKLLMKMEENHLLIEWDAYAVMQSPPRAT